MIDFLMISTKSSKRGTIEVYPKFIIKKSSDLMIRGGDFYAIWLEEERVWSTDEQDALQLIDKELDEYAEKAFKKSEDTIKILHMWDAESGMIDSWHKYCQKQSRDSYHMLDEKLIFSNTDVSKRDYASKRLSYPLEEGDISAYDKLMSTLYSEEERQKIEWAIGSVVSGDSKKLQKFMVLYGAAGTGKSTVLNIIQQLFEGYYSVFDAKALGSANSSFALEPFKTNPLVAIQHDADLSHIEDNTRLNSLVSHELMTVNEKFKSTYSNRFKCFLFIGTNKPVKITDAKSGLIRRLIDVSPTGEKLGAKEYRAAVKQVEFELGPIASHCLDVYKEAPDKYDDYIPLTMLGASNDFYNFMQDSYYIFKSDDGVSMKTAWEMYKTYCDEAKVPYPLSQRPFKEELRNYFRECKERYSLEDGSRVRSYYSGFKTEKFESQKTEEEQSPYTIEFGKFKSIFDTKCAEYPAQYASDEGTPLKKWANVGIKLKDIDTSKLHYVRVPENHIVVDFDIADKTGQKCYEKNLEEASKWPPTYAELSKSGCGIHLHYIYTGDVGTLSRIYSDQIEIKVFSGNSSLRRKLTKCNKLPISSISSGLPLKGDKVVNFEIVKSEKGVRSRIRRNLNREIHANTKPSIDLIYKTLEDAYSSGVQYDVTDLKNDIIAFAAQSSHQADYCLKLVDKMHFKSEADPENAPDNESPLVFYDVEVFPNLLVVNWKIQGENHPVVRMINPKSAEIEGLLKYRLVGFNCRRYDNHILYARLIGYTNEQLYDLSQKIISGAPNCFFGEAYNISYTDVYDFAAAGHKQSLKKFEIELGIHHQELGLPWDQPVPEELWTKVAAYCDNDVIATEATFNYLKGDWTAREMLADVAGKTVNDTTNSQTAKIVFENNKNPQDQFNYRNMGDVSDIDRSTITKDNVMYNKFGDEFTVFNSKGQPIFPGYVYDHGKSTYRDEEVGEGGYVYSEPGTYGDVALLDIASMHPSSIIAENLFGDSYTARFKELVDARIYIKHKEYDKAKKLLGGKLEKYLTDKDSAKQLSKALKTPINAAYGLTSASFDNPFRDRRNVDNIVAKRGALFMINLKHEVKERGFTVAHIKTDSIKIPDATPDIIQFVLDYGHQYGYNFEHEATYDRMCLVNDAVYIAKYTTVEHCCELYGKEYVNSSDDILKDNKESPGEWTATGTQFQVPYVFKKLFSKEDIRFEDLCETKSVTTALYLDMNENLPSDEHDYHFIGKVGQFCPIKPGGGGGQLLREILNKKTGEKGYASATGAKGYLWLESEMVKELNKEDDIDRSYYDRMVDEAVKTISEHGDYEWFVSDDPYLPSDPPWNQSDAPWYDQTPFDVR